jgi:hypothetical protein
LMQKGGLGHQLAQIKQSYGLALSSILGKLGLSYSQVDSLRNKS